MNHLAHLFKSGLQFSSVASARAAVSVFLRLQDDNSAESPLLERLMKGMTRLRPALPKYHFTWDVKAVLVTLLK